MRLWLLLTFIISSAAWAEKIEIKSNPEEAEIFVSYDDTTAPQKIGKTPTLRRITSSLNFEKKATSRIEFSLLKHRTWMLNYRSIWK